MNTYRNLNMYIDAGLRVWRKKKTASDILFCTELIFFYIVQMKEFVDFVFTSSTRLKF